MSIERYFLGCPIWSFPGWKGTLYGSRTPPRDFLREYGQVFNTVEGNTTFYSVPSATTVERWREALPERFRFSFKFPQAITHHLSLLDASEESAAFLERLAPLEPRLGPFLLQLPPSFGPRRLLDLDRFLAALPSGPRIVVEVRHGAFFADAGVGAAAARGELDALLKARGCDRVIFDTRGLRSGDPEDPDLRAARDRKPDLPVLPVALGKTPLVRFIAHPDEELDRPFLLEWRDHLVRWIAEGRTPYFMVHCSDDLHAPRLARLFHQLLREEVEVGEMPPWLGESEPREPVQLSLL